MNIRQMKIARFTNTRASYGEEHAALADLGDGSLRLELEESGTRMVVDLNGNEALGFAEGVAEISLGDDGGIALEGPQGETLRVHRTNWGDPYEDGLSISLYCIPCGPDSLEAEVALPVEVEVALPGYEAKRFQECLRTLYHNCAPTAAADQGGGMAP